VTPNAAISNFTCEPRYLVAAFVRFWVVCRPIEQPLTVLLPDQAFPICAT
jgi:hypothetical protein